MQQQGIFLRESYWWGKFMVIDLSSELKSELGDGGSRPEGSGVLGEGAVIPPLPPAMGLESTAVSSPNGVRGKAPVAVDFEGFGI